MAPESEALDHPAIAERLDSVGWGLFFVWVGVAVLLDVGWSVGLLGVGVILLGEQGVRRYLGLGVEGFWVAVGVLLLLGGIWESFEIEVPLVPILLMVAGAALILSALRRR